MPSTGAAISKQKGRGLRRLTGVVKTTLPSAPFLPRVTWGLRKALQAKTEFYLFFLATPNKPSKPEPSNNMLVGSGMAVASSA